MTITTKTDWTEAAQAVESASSILVVTHIFPDGDAIGTLLGITNALRAYGKQVDAVVDGGVPEFLHFLPGQETVRSILTSGQWDLMISTDSSDEARTGQSGAYGRAHSQTVINLDHHATNTLFGNIYLVDSSAVSASQIAYEWINKLGIVLSREIALPLLTGLVTDTLGFRTSNVTPHTLEIAQSLLQTGISLAEITARTLDSRRYEVLNVWKYALQSVMLEDGVIYARVMRDDIKRAGANENTEIGLSSFLIQTDEAMISAVFREGINTVELSFRAKYGYDVSQVAFAIGGGGHKQASGATVEGTVDSVIARVLPMLKEAVRQGKKVFA